MNKLIGIMLASLIYFNCRNNILREDLESIIIEAPNESLIPIKSENESLFFYKNSKGECEYIQKINENGEIELYKYSLTDEGIIKEVPPRFRLIDKNYDGIRDIGLIYVSKGNYDTVKPSFIYVLIN